MGNKSSKNSGGVVYSTNPGFDFFRNDEKEIETLPSAGQNLRLHLERKGGGKIVTAVKGFVGTEKDLKQLGKKLKKYCGTGGSVKQGMILIQGNVRDKVSNFLVRAGYQVKNSGG